MSGYIGTQPVPQATQTRDSFTATSGQTSFATGGYTPNFLDVYLNGVKLAAADYTATNGSDVVLASGASTGDILEVVAFTTFNSASSSIDDNGNATAITIDSSENVLIGKTSSSYNTVGSELLNNGVYKGLGQFTTDGTNALTLNRKSSDGEIAIFRKDGTTVGSIQSRAGSITSLVLNPSGSDGAGFTGGSNAILPVSASALVDNTIDLGVGSYRYNDLFLGGGVYLGGTAAANKLDDYEEGTWTPNPTFGTQATGMTFSTLAGGYTKVGRVVYVSGRIVFSNKGSSTGGFQIYGLPFTSSNLGEGFYGGGTLPYVHNLANPTSWEVAQYLVIDTNNSYIYMRYANSSGGSSNHDHSDINNTSDLLFQAIYTTDA